MKSIVLQKTANREVRFGWHDLPVARKKATDNASVQRLEEIAKSVAFSMQEVIKTPTASYLYDRANESIRKFDISEASQLEAQIQRHLDITSEFRRQNDSTKRKRKVHGVPNRRTVFGKSARHTLLEAGSCAEKWSGSPDKSVVVTLTLPGSTQEAYATLAAWSGYAWDRMARRLRKYGNGIRWFYVWEFQKRGALHLHLLIAAQSPNLAMEAGTEVRAVWFDVLRDITDKSGVDLFLHSSRDCCTAREYWQNDIQQLRKSIAAYFVKYASKEALNAGKAKWVNIHQQKYYPSRWWGCQRILRREVEAERTMFALEGLTEEEVVDCTYVINRCLQSEQVILEHSYSFDLEYLRNSRSAQVGHGWRMIRYYNDDGFQRIHAMVLFLMQTLTRKYPRAVVKCNRMSAMRASVEVNLS